MIVFLVYELLLSALALAGFGPSGDRQNSPANPWKSPRPSNQAPDRKSIIGDDPGSIVIFSLRFPVRQGESGHAGLPARPAGRVGSLAAGDRVSVLAAGRQPMLVPATGGVSGAEDLAAPRDAVDLVGIARVEGHTHHRGLGLDAVVEAPPAPAEIVAPKKRSVRALRGWAEAGIQDARLVRRHADVAAVAHRREAADLHVLPALAPVGAAKEALAHRDEDRARPGGADREGVAVEHPLAVPRRRGGPGEPDQICTAILPALTVIKAAHDAVDLEHGIDLGRAIRVLGQTHDPAGKRHPDALGELGLGKPAPVVAAVL